VGVNACDDPGRLGRPHPWDLNGGCDYSAADSRPLAHVRQAPFHSSLLWLYFSLLHLRK
jgi:hypothetical protein